MEMRVTSEGVDRHVTSEHVDMPAINKVKAVKPPVSLNLTCAPVFSM